MSIALLPDDFPSFVSTLEESSSGDGTYPGPLYPRVVELDAGSRRRVDWNEHQSSGPSPTEYYWGEPYPRIRMRPDQGPEAFELWITPGFVTQGRLSATGQVISKATATISYPYQWRPSPHPTWEGQQGAEGDPRDPCSRDAPGFEPEFIPVLYPITGEVRYTEWETTPEGCGALLRRNGELVAKEEWPFAGLAAFFGPNQLQGPAPQDPTEGIVQPGTRGYEKGTPFAPWAPWSDPESEWYGRPVRGEGPPAWEGGTQGPAQPVGDPYDPPCRPCDERTLIAGRVMCIPRAGCTDPIPDPDPCVVGYSTTPPYGPIIDYDCRFPGDPGPDGNGGTGGNGGGGGGTSGGGDGGPGPSPGGTAPVPIELPRWWPAALIGILLVKGAGV